MEDRPIKDEAGAVGGGALYPLGVDGAEVRRPAHVPRGQIGAGAMIHDYLSPRPTTPEDRPIRCDADRPRQLPRGCSAMAG